MRIVMLVFLLGAHRRLLAILRRSTTSLNRVNRFGRLPAERRVVRSIRFALQFSRTDERWLAPSGARRT